MLKLDDKKLLVDEKAPFYREFSSRDYAYQVLFIFKLDDKEFDDDGVIETAIFRIEKIKQLEESIEIQEQCNLMLYWIEQYKVNQIALNVLKEKIIQILDKFENVEVK